VLTAEAVKQRAREIGFDLCGVAPAAAAPELAFLREWLERGYAGEMQYMSRSADRRADARAVLPSARSVVMLAVVYNADRPYSVERADPREAKIARYAWGDDYHAVIGTRLEALTSWMRGAAGAGLEARAYVDTGPVQERGYAQQAGLGWIGKHTCLIHPELGSWLFLAAIICSAPLEPDTPGVDQCGACTLCLEACPTGALVAPRVLDARRCLSYLTIEIRGSIPAGQRPSLGAHVFGCDICQDVCPQNAAAPAAGDACWQPKAPLRDATLETLWTLDDTGLQRTIEGTALRRASVRGLRRNLAVAIGNAGQTLAGLLSPRMVPGTISTGGGAESEVPGTFSHAGRPSLDDPMVAEHLDWARRRTP